MIISEKQIFQLMQAVQTISFRYAAEGKHEEAKALITFLKIISDQQCEKLKKIE